MEDVPGPMGVKMTDAMETEAAASGKAPPIMIYDPVTDGERPATEAESHYCGDRFEPYHDMRPLDLNCGPGDLSTWPKCESCDERTVCTKCNNKTCLILIGNHPKPSPVSTLLEDIGKTALPPNAQGPGPAIRPPVPGVPGGSRAEVGPWPGFLDAHVLRMSAG